MKPEAIMVKERTTWGALGAMGGRICSRKRDERGERAAQLGLATSKVRVRRLGDRFRVSCLYLVPD